MKLRRNHFLLAIGLLLLSTLGCCHKPQACPAPAPESRPEPVSEAPKPEPKPAPVPVPTPPKPVTVAKLDSPTEVKAVKPKQSAKPKSTPYKRSSSSDVLVNCDDLMYVGQLHPLTVRVKASTLDLMDWQDGLPGSHSVTATIAKSKQVKIEVIPSPVNAKCKITTTSPAIQEILEHSFIEWKFFVQPLEVGSVVLSIVPSVVNPTTNGISELKQETISIRVESQGIAGRVKARSTRIADWIVKYKEVLGILGGALTAIVGAWWAWRNRQKSKET